jgi:hypothetical protein
MLAVLTARKIFFVASIRAIYNVTAQDVSPLLFKLFTLKYNLNDFEGMPIDYKCSESVKKGPGHCGILSLRALERWTLRS